MESLSRCAAMKESRSSPWTLGGISVPEFDRSRVELVIPPSREVAALTAEARRE